MQAKASPHGRIDGVTDSIVRHEVQAVGGIHLQGNLVVVAALRVQLAVLDAERVERAVVSAVVAL
jgi:hypothetical protein